jgi:hypothetical protein
VKPDRKLTQGHGIEFNNRRRRSPAVGVALNYLGCGKWWDSQFNTAARCNLGELTHDRFHRQSGVIFVNLVDLLRN